MTHLSKWIPGNRKGLLLAVGSVLVLAAVWALSQYLTGPSKPWWVRWQITRHLQKHRSVGKEKLDFPFPSKAEMARASGDNKAQPDTPKQGSRTGKDFQTLAEEYLKLKTEAVVLDREISEGDAALGAQQVELDELTKQLAETESALSSTNLSSLRSKAKRLRNQVAALQKKRDDGRPLLEAKETALRPLVSDLWEFQQGWVEERRAAEAALSKGLAAVSRKFVSDMARKLGEAGTYQQMYTLIGQELLVSKTLLKSANPNHRRAGLSIALQAARHAYDHAMDPWLAARICEGYLWPNLDLADVSDRRSPLYLETLLNECARFFKENDELSNVARNYEILVPRASSPQRADWARLQVALAYEQEQNFQAALDYLRQIEYTNDFRWALQRIPQLEDQLNP